MLPAELLVVRAARGRLLPLFLTMREEELYIAEELVRTFEEHVGRKRGELEEKLGEIEERAFRLGVHYKVVRGLAHILLRESTFSAPQLPVEPVRVRLEVFRAAGRLGAAVSEAERVSVVREVAGKLGLKPEEVEVALKAVHEDEETLSRFEPVKPEDLIREYNLSAAQTVLFRALNVKAAIRASGTEVKHLLRWVKRLGLMYTASASGSMLVLELEGPASLLRQTERYGTRLAKLLPFIVAAEHWSVSAQVKGRRGQLLFELSSDSAPPLPKREPQPVEYDSSVEREFHKSFLSAGSGWSIVREPEPLVAGSHVLIPDFAFEKNGVKVYMEIVGFWTPGYLKRKVEKLRALSGVTMIVAVDEEGACATGPLDLPHTVITFRRKVPVERVYRILKSLEVERREPREELREARKVPPEALKLLENAEGKTLDQVIRELTALGLTEEECFEAIRAAGLEIEWRGLDIGASLLRRAKRA
ncbi:MAG: DUF790 family protein [Thermofilum sp.]